LSYNSGQKPDEICKQVQEEFIESFDDSDDKNNSLFALAFALWETKSPDTEVYKQVKYIIETGNDLELWKELGADIKTIGKRKKELEKFLTLISTEREKPKRRSRSRHTYDSNQILTLPAPDGQKTFEIIEFYVNHEYKHTSSGITWTTGGGAVFYFYTKGKFVNARWIDSQTLEITHDKTIEFAKKEERFYYCGDQGIIRYIAE
jgi:hypothetical protein